jgi:hypothetical protein
MPTSRPYRVFLPVVCYLKGYLTLADLYTFILLTSYR